MAELRRLLREWLWRATGMAVVFSIVGGFGTLRAEGSLGDIGITMLLIGGGVFQVTLGVGYIVIGARDFYESIVPED